MSSDELNYPLFQLAVDASDVRAVLERIDWASPKVGTIEAAAEAVSADRDLGYRFALQERLLAFIAVMEAVRDLNTYPVDVISNAVASCPLQIRRKAIGGSIFDRKAFENLLHALSPAGGKIVLAQGGSK